MDSHAKMRRPAGDKRRRPEGDKSQTDKSQTAEKSQDAVLAELSYPLAEVQDALLRLVQQAYELGVKRGEEVG